MNVFISWSGAGEMSERAAEAIRNWLPLVLQSVQPWMSAKDIYAGARWSHELAKQLSASNFGILCVTRESLHKPWLLFEAGSLAKSLDEGCVIPLLVDLDPAELSGPLTQFQSQKLDKDGMWSVIGSLNRRLAAPVPTDRLRKAFEVFWPELESTRERLLSEAATLAPEAPRPAPVSDGATLLTGIEQILSRLTTLEAAVASPRSGPEIVGTPVVTSGARGRQETTVTWLKDLLMVLDNFLEELSVREYQIEARGSTDSPIYQQIQDEMQLANEVSAFVKQRLPRSAES